MLTHETTLAVGETLIADTASEGPVSFHLSRIAGDGSPVFWCRPWSAQRTVFVGNAWHFPERNRMSGPGAVIGVIAATKNTATVRLQLPDGGTILGVR